MADEIFSRSVPAGGKTYFFDVKQAKAGKQSKYLQITETRMSEGQRLRSSITIFPDHFEAFVSTIAQAKEHVA